MNKTYTLQEAQYKLEQYCVYQERCHQEVIFKLHQMNMITEAVDTILSSLITNDYINETRYAQNYARGKHHQKKWGRVRIIRELKIRDISDYNIDIALKEINDEYLDNFYKISNNLCNHISEKNIYKKRKKLIDRLRYRGWESNLVYERVQELIPSP